MNRRKAIFAIVCAAAGRPVPAQTIGAESLIVNSPTPTWFYLSLNQISKFVFEYNGKQVEISGEDIWKELQP